MSRSCLTRILKVETNYKEGDLVRIKNHRQWSVCVPTDTQGRGAKVVREFSMSAIPMGFGKSFLNLEEKLGLVVKVVSNRLDQPQGYKVQIGQDVWFFKSVLADKYFELVGDQGNEERRSCKV